jgi:uncharacterized phage-associated protein
MKAVDVAKDLIFLMDIYNLNNIENIPDSTSIDMGKTKLQKIMYAVMGVALKVGITPKTSLVNKDNNLIVSLFDEVPEAWPYGPVFKKIYRSYDQLRTEALDVKYKPFYEIKEGKSISEQRDDEIMQCILQAFIDSEFVKQTAITLSNWSHKDGSPWKDTCIKHGTYGYEMDTFAIKDYFDKLKKEDIFNLDIDQIMHKADEIRSKYIEKYKNRNK